MGQYFKPAILGGRGNVKAWMYSHDHIEKFIRRDGVEVEVGVGLKLLEHSWIGNKFVGSFASLLVEGGEYPGERVVWAGDYAKRRTYDRCTDRNKLEPREPLDFDKFPYIVNLDKHEYVDVRTVPGRTYEFDEDGMTWRIHPLPLLTCTGNGMGGGGDFFGPDPNKLVGRWSGDHIVIAAESPTTEQYQELLFDLMEE